MRFLHFISGPRPCVPVLRPVFSRLPVSHIQWASQTGARLIFLKIEADPVSGSGADPAPVSLMLHGAYRIHSKLFRFTQDPPNLLPPILQLYFLLFPNLYFLHKLCWTPFPVRLEPRPNCTTLHLFPLPFSQLLLILQAPAPRTLNYSSSHKTCHIESLVICLSIYLLQEVAS